LIFYFEAIPASLLSPALVIIHLDP